MSDTPEHEFDHLKGTSYDNHRNVEPEEEVSFGGEPPHNPHKMPIPEQKPITHELAPKGARPPQRRFTGIFHSDDEMLPGSIEDVARKQYEEGDA